MDGWMDGFRQRGRHAGASPKLLGNAATIERDEERAREQRGKEKPCLQWRDLAGLPLLCLSGSGLQRQRKSNVQAWWWWRWIEKNSASAPKRREKKNLQTTENSALKGLRKRKKRNTRFHLFEPYSKLETLDPSPDQVSETKWNSTSMSS